MAVAAPKRRSVAAPAPAPARTTPPKRRRKAAAAPAPARSAPAKPSRKRAPTKASRAVAAPARAPQRSRPQPKRAAPRRAQPRLALVVGRTAATVRDLPDSGLIVRLTRGRAWIGVLGVLLAGIVALNVVTLSFASSLGKVDEQMTTLEAENSVLGNRLATKNASPRIHAEGRAVGLVSGNLEEAAVIQATPGDAATAAARLAAAGG